MGSESARRRSLALASLAVLGAAVALAWFDHGGTTAHAQPAPISGEGQAGARAIEDEGEHLYLRDCAVCHGPRGTGTPFGPSLEAVGAASVHFQLMTGRMPISGPSEGLQRPTAPDYSREQIIAIVAHTEPIVAGGPDIPALRLEGADVAKGGELYRTHCGSCHGTAGSGGALIGARPAPGLGAVDPIETAEAMLVGPGTMPTFSPEPLGDREMNEIVAYVDDVLRDPEDPGGFHLWHLGPVPEGAVGWIVGLGTVMLIARWIGTSMKDKETQEQETQEQETQEVEGP